MAKTKRHDPPSVSPAAITRTPDLVVGAEDDRVYRWTNPNCLETGLERYLAEGWTQEYHREGGPYSPSLRLQAEDTGKPVKNRIGYFLVSMPRDEFVAAYEAPQQAHTKSLEDRILRRKTGIEDPMRGIRGIAFENATSREYVERA